MKIKSVLDTSVIFPSLVRDILLSLAATEIFQPIWSKNIIIELKKNLIKKRSFNEEKALQLVKAMEDCFPNANRGMISSEGLSVDQFPDRNDHHIVNLAIQERANFIVTENLSDFPLSSLKQYNIEALSVDKFLECIWRGRENIIFDSVEEMRKRYQKPSLDIQDLLENMKKNKLNTFSKLIINFKE